MINFIENILSRFESCFSRKTAFGWFVILITGLMLRSDRLGITSVIRDLALRPDCYDSMLHFFRASSWNLDSIRTCWFRAVKEHAPLYKEGSFHILVGDGVKQSKEGRRIPAVKKLFQESENSAKPAYIFGHMFGGLGILAGTIRRWVCIPLSIRLHDGLQAASGWKEASVSSASHVVQMVQDAYRAASVLGDSILLLDRYFLTVPALKTLKSLNKDGQVHMEIVTKAKRSCTAYEKPGPRKPGRRGRPPKKGAAVRLRDLFVSHAGQFREADMELYGKKEHVRYYSIDLLWGQKLYQELRFVLVEISGVQSMLACTSLTLDPPAIIRLYSYRFRIECTFRELKQQVGAFCYHFWTKHMPKLSHYQKKDAPSPLEQVKTESSRKKVLKTVRAIEMHMMLSCIAMGILQILSLCFMGKVSPERLRYQRTPSRGRISEAAVMDYLRKHFFRLLNQSPGLRITRIIQEQQEDMPEVCEDLLAS